MICWCLSSFLRFFRLEKELTGARCTSLQLRLSLDAGSDDIDRERDGPAWIKSQGEGQWGGYSNETVSGDTHLDNVCSVTVFHHKRPSIFRDKKCSPRALNQRRTLPPTLRGRRRCLHSEGPPQLQLRLSALKC